MVRFGLVGVGGYAKTYVTALEKLQAEGLARISVAVVRHPERYAAEAARLREQGVRIVPTTEAMYAEAREQIDLVAIPTGIPTHAPLTIQAHEQGFSVMLEKPPAAVVQDVDAMLEAGRRAGRFCAVGFQGLTSPTIRGLKERIVGGKFGRLRLLANKGQWKRLDSYYERNAWAGKLRVDGHWTLDGPAINALAHQLNNMLFLAGPSLHEAAEPAWVRAELYRAHRVEGEDTSCIEVMTTGGVRILFYATFCSRRNDSPRMEIEGSQATAEWEMNGLTRVRYADGSQEEFDDGPLVAYDLIAEMFRNVVRFYRGEVDHLNCALAMTRPFVLAIDGAYCSNGWPRAIPEAFIRREPEGPSVATGVEGLDEAIDRAFAERKLLSDLGVPWAKATRRFDLAGFTRFEADCVPASGKRPV